MSEDKGRRRDARKEVQRTGSVDALDLELAKWLARLWTRDDGPTRIEVWQKFGQNKIDYGAMIHNEDFKAHSKYDIEQCVMLSNEIMDAAQHDCDCIEHKQSYELRVIDMARKGVPLARRIGPLRPQSHYLAKPGEEVNDEDEEGNGKLTNAQTLALRYTEASIEATKWDKAHYGKVFGEVFLLLQNEVKEARQQSTELMTQVRGMLTEVVGAIRSREEALSMEEERKEDREWRVFKRDLLKDGARTVRNLLPGFFAGQGHGDTVPEEGKPAPMSPERMLVDNFLRDCEDTGVIIKLFGDCEVKEGKLKLVDETKPGIFTLAQFTILFNVQNNLVPTDALIALLPDSGRPEAITPDQIKRAQPHMTEGVGTALLELVGLCQRRRDFLQQAAVQPPQAQQATTKGQ